MLYSDGQGYLARGYVACCGVVTEQNSAVFPFRPVVCGLQGCVHIPGVNWFLIADRPARVYNGSEIAVYSGVVLRSEKRGTELMGMVHVTVWGNVAAVKSSEPVLVLATETTQGVEER